MKQPLVITGQGTSRKELSETWEYETAEPCGVVASHTVTFYSDGRIESAQLRSRTDLLSKDAKWVFDNIGSMIEHAIRQYKDATNS